MIQYALECIGFQLLFLIIYDVILKRETFFQWNRVYLIGTYILSLVLPWIKIDALKTTAPKALVFYPESLWNSIDLEINGVTSQTFGLGAVTIILLVGIVIAAVLFVFKLNQIRQLKAKGEIKLLNDFTQVTIKNSEVAFSFFNSVFLGDKISEKDYKGIIQHELVHICQGHTYDLLFFELFRVANWFNPLVYVYQNRISEVHEFIADAQVAKTNKKEQYQLLLSQVFQTQNISFINPFFKSSLIKKRIVMLQKTKSKKVFQLKYLLLVPSVIGMLFYTSCESEVKSEKTESGTTLKANKTEVNYDSELDVPFAIVDEVPIFPGCVDAEDQRACFQEKMYQHISKNFNYPLEAQEKGIQGKVSVMFTIETDGSISNIKMRGPSKLLEDETERIISRLPIMTPGKQKGKNVRVPFSVPITFKLQ